MTDRFVDLHVHSTCSDGTKTPSELVKLAQEKHLAAFALTDHDSVNGIAEAMEAAEGTGIEVIPGIEYSTEYEGHDIHIVGLYYDWQNPDFQKEVQVFTQERVRRNQKMCAKMAADGIPISYEALTAANPGSVITRANIARFLMEHHVVSSINEAFDRYIGDGCPYFIPREKISPEQAVRFTLQYHGIPILAHPFQYDLGGVPMTDYLPSEEPDEPSITPARTEKITVVTTGLDRLVRQLKAAGLVGIEAWYCRHTPLMREQVRALARRYQLLLSGGSDYHGANKPGLEMGTGYGPLAVPEELLIRMKHYLHHVTDHTKIFFCDFDGTLGTSAKTISPVTRKALDAFVARGKENLVPDASSGPNFILPEHADGNLFVLSSGRAMSDVKNLWKKLHLDYPDMYLSGYNGAELYSCSTGRTFMRKTIPLPTVRRVMDLAREYGLYCQTYDKDDIVVQSAEDAGVTAARELTEEERKAWAEGRLPMPLSPENPDSRGMLDPAVPPDGDVRCGATEMPPAPRDPAGTGQTAAAQAQTTSPHLQRETAYYTTYVKMPVRLERDVPGSLSEAPCKCLAIHLENPEDHRLEALRQRLHDEFGDELTLVKSNPYYLEIDAQNATKGFALEWFCRYLGIARKNSISAGDAANDIPMLRAAGTGIGMSNGAVETPGLAEAADIVTTADNDHDGLAPILNQL